MKCTKCRGYGIKEKPCAACKGSGKGKNGVNICPDCKGLGTKLVSCSMCKGSGDVAE